MIELIVSSVLIVFALALLSGVLLALVAFVAGTVLHAWGATSALQWIIEAFLRVFARGVRRRVRRKVNRQTHVGLDKSRRPYPYIAVAVSTDDVPALTGPGGTLSIVAAEVVTSYLRYARAQGWACDPIPQVAIVPEEWLRRGSVRVRPISGQEFNELWHEMGAWDEALKDDQNATAPDPCPMTRVDDQTNRFHTEGRAAGDVAAVTAGPPDVVTEALDSAHAPTVPAEAVRMILANDQGGQHQINADSVLIGRSRECGVQLEGAEVSREHVKINFQDGTWWLRDRGSRNGTTVDGQQVAGTSPVRLNSGSQIVLGGKRTGEKLTIASLVEL